MGKDHYTKGYQGEKTRLERANMGTGRTLDLLEQIEENIAYYEGDAAKKADAAGRLDAIRDHRRKRGG